MADSHLASDSGSPAPKPPSRFQFSLRSLLAVTSLLAWFLGLMGAMGIGLVALIGWLTLTEAACTPRANLLNTLVRNLFAGFVCSLFVGVVGFGLMCGRNPADWCGTDGFLFSPLTGEKPMDLEGVGRSRPFRPGSMAKSAVLTQRNRLLWSIIVCSMAVVIAQRLLVGRAGIRAYVLLWIFLSTITIPILGRWSHTHWTNGQSCFVDHFLLCPGEVSPELLVAGGWIVLAGIPVLGRKPSTKMYCRGLMSAECHGVLLRIGLGLPLVFVVLLGWNVAVFPLVGQPMPRNELAVVAAIVSGVVAAGVSSLVWQRRLHIPLMLAGGTAATLAIMIAVATVEGHYLGSIHPGLASATAIGVVTGALVVGATWTFERMGWEDPAGSVAIFGVGGTVGLIALPLLPESILAGVLWGRPEPSITGQLLDVAFLLTWTLLTSGAVFWAIRRKMLLKTGEPDVANGAIGTGESADI